MAGKETSPIYLPEHREVQSECGLSAIYLNDPSYGDIRLMSVIASTALQHRAEGAAGMYVSNGFDDEIVKELGTVAVAFDEGRRLPKLDNAQIAITHLRYPTSGGSNHKANIQPLLKDGIWFAHHGNLTNARQIEESLGDIKKGGDEPDSDSWVALNAVVKADGTTLEEKLINAQQHFQGGWAFIASDGTSLVASRDPYGIRPLSVGVLESEEDPAGYILSVESCVYRYFNTAQFYEVLPGETIKIDESGIQTLEHKPKDQQYSCLFEFMYMMRPDSVFLGKRVFNVRREAGRLLWQDHPVYPQEGETLRIMPVPNSGRPSALGYYHEARKDLGDQVEWDEALLANAYYGRNFIKDSGKRAADLKFYPIPDLFDENTVIVLVDDTIVRGDTTGKTVDMSISCIKSGAKNVHVRVPAPEIKNPCPYGVNMSTYEEFIANRIPNISEREQFLKATSLRHLSLDRLIQATGLPKEVFCTQCLDGKGPPLAMAGVIPLRPV